MIYLTIGWKDENRPERISDLVSVATTLDQAQNNRLSLISQKFRRITTCAIDGQPGSLRIIELETREVREL